MAWPGVMAGCGVSNWNSARRSGSARTRPGAARCRWRICADAVVHSDGGSPTIQLTSPIVNVVRSLKVGTPAGPDPWKANTLEWFTPSPPPEHNFDAVPRVRSVEPMKDYRRQVEELTGSEQRFESGRPMAHV